MCQINLPDGDAEVRAGDVGLCAIFFLIFLNMMILLLDVFLLDRQDEGLLTPAQTAARATDEEW